MIRPARWLAAATAVVVLAVPGTAAATPSPSSSSPSASPSASAPAPTGTATGPSSTAQTFLAQLADLQTEATALQTDLTTQQATTSAALARYDQATQAVQAAVATAAAAQQALTSANVDVAATRRQAQLEARDAYVDSVPHTSSALLLTTNPGDLDFTIAALSYLSGRADVALGRLEQAQDVAAGFAAKQSAALADAQRLQVTADTDRATALDSLGRVQADQAAFGADVDALRTRAAAAAAAFGTTPADLAAYQTFLAGLTALIAAPPGTTFVAGGPGLTPLPGTSWVRPLTTYTISSCYCLRGGTFHHGVDLAAPLGTPIYAVGAGTVVAAGPANGFGNWVVVDHHDGSFSIYGHMRVLATVVGATVGPGTLVAYVGDEGESSGPHLHFEVRVGSYANSSDSTDPVLWLAQRGVSLS